MTSSNRADCIFCRVAQGEIPSTKVAESDRVLAFSDINPGAPQHVLLIPKGHVADSVADLDLSDPEGLATWNEILSLAQEIAGSSVEFADGWRLVSNVGENGGQSVFHLHIHLLAGRKLTWPPG